MSRKLLTGALAIIVMALAVYAWMGGFSRLNFGLYSSPAIILSGKEFTGRPGQKELESLFYHMRDLAADRDTSLIVVTYPPADSTGLITQFVGVPGISADTLESRRWDGGEFVSVRLTQHLMVTPSPAKITEMASEFAAASGREITGVSIEIYARDRDTQVLFPLAR